MFAVYSQISLHTQKETIESAVNLIFKKYLEIKLL